MGLLLQSHPPEMQSMLLIPVKIITINITKLYCIVKSDDVIRFSKINENRIVPYYQNRAACTNMSIWDCNTKSA